MGLVVAAAVARLTLPLLWSQIPGKLLFSLVKRYLCVTSLMDKLNSTGAESGAERADASPSPSSSASQPTEQLRLQREFDFTMAMANLISELVRVMGWDRNQQPPEAGGPLPGGGGAKEEQSWEEARPVLRSIFQPRFCSSPAVLAAASTAATATPLPPKKKTGTGYKSRADFAGRSAYVEYVQDNLKSGMMVRMLEDYEDVSAGDEGDFRYSNDGSPPVQVRRGHRGRTRRHFKGVTSQVAALCLPSHLGCLLQVYWNSLSRTYWVHWHMVEILGTNQTEKETQEKATSLTETLRLSAGENLTGSLTCVRSCQGMIVLSVVLSEPDLLLQTPWRSLFAALPGRQSLCRTGAPEPGRVVGAPILHKEAGVQAAAGGQRPVAAES